MNKKYGRYFYNFICILFAAVLVFGTVPISAYASETYISEITLATGKNGMTKLEENGYTVLFQGMNLVTGDDSIVYLGYKTGTDAITDLVVSTEKSDTADSDGITYKLASGTNLNYGAGGTAIYLYYTKDTKAGSGIKSLDTVSGFSGTDEVLALQNDGSSPVRMLDGKIANFDAGIDSNLLYVMMYRSGEVRPYISKVCVASGSSKAEAVKSAAGKGCDYYVDHNISSDGGVKCIAYQRTSDKSKAITGFSIDGTEVKTAKNQEAGTYLLDVSKYKLFSDSFTVGDWSGIYASCDRTVSKSSSAFKNLEKDASACSCVSAGDGSGIYAIYLGNYQGLKEAAETTAASTTETTTATAESDTAVSEDVTDEITDISKEDINTETSVQEDEDAASVLGSGNVKSIVILMVLIILVVAGILIYKRGRNRKHEKDA